MWSGTHLAVELGQESQGERRQPVWSSCLSSILLFSLPVSFFVTPSLLPLHPSHFLHLNDFFLQPICAFRHIKKGWKEAKTELRNRYNQNIQFHFISFILKQFASQHKRINSWFPTRWFVACWFQIKAQILCFRLVTWHISSTSKRAPLHISGPTVAHSSVS